jgi:hypothetical protein
MPNWPCCRAYPTKRKRDDSADAVHVKRGRWEGSAGRPSGRLQAARLLVASVVHGAAHVGHEQFDGAGHQRRAQPVYRKLVMLCYGVLKHRAAFDTQWASKSAS